ncbi:OLC1v1024162C1 [Oldenlandia corymbosa var. corymbosa]|uniref:OLC1v1024162C1 n=1 Tax=Oldenlandia corymbosa var. corymbosa TaxID=529605 RepID=A0AAV1C2L5_OLDCO|nr:OLC1v1024162C1 [Oldenlandia corymbosa var. corymbosa]
MDSIFSSLPFSASADPTFDNFSNCLTKNGVQSNEIPKILYNPTNPSFTSVLNAYVRNLRFNTSTTKKPSIIVTPFQVQQVQATVICTKSSGLQLKTRSGGHDYEGISYVSANPFVILDMFNLRSVAVDIPSKTAVPITENNKKMIRLTFIGLYLENSNSLQALMKSQFPELGLLPSDCKQMSWIQAMLFWANFKKSSPKPEALLSRTPDSVSFLKRKSDYVLKPIPSAGLTAIFNKMVQLGDVGLVFNPYGGKMSQIPESETPFPHRAGVLYKIQYSSNWGTPDPKLAAQNLQEARDLYTFMTPYVSSNPRQAFLNYRDLDIGTTDNGPNSYNEGKVYGMKYFKGNFDRLVKVKTAVDPQNFFRNEQSIPKLPSK